MKIILDFDHTIFNMMEMHREMRDAVVSLGVSEQDYELVYGEITRWKMFTVDAFARRLEKVTGINADDVRVTADTLAEQSYLYLYDDVIEALEKLRNAGHEILILSWGDKDWQGKKIRHSGLLDYVHDAFTVQEMKSEHLKSAKEKDIPVLFVDDKPIELKLIQKQHDDLHLVRMRRINGKYADHETPERAYEVQDMHQLASLIEQIEKNQ